MCANGSSTPKHSWRGRLLLAHSGGLLLGAAHLVLQPRAARNGPWDPEDPSAWRGFLQDIFVSPAASGSLEKVFSLHMPCFQKLG